MGDLDIFQRRVELGDLPPDMVRNVGGLSEV
jgi:hypothetical protein